MGDTRMEHISVLVVGPTGGKSGGIGRYIVEQLRHLDDEVSVDLYNTKTVGSSDGALELLRGVVDGVANWARFPFARRPDVVHVHTSHYFSFYLSSFYVLYAAYVWKRPVILHVHGSSFDEFVRDAPLPRALFQSLVFDATDAVVVLSEYWRTALSTRVEDRKLVVLPNAVVLDQYDPDVSPDAHHLVFVSNHVERKGIVEATEAIARLYDEGFEFQTTIAGTGPLSHHAEALADEYEHVEYVGYITEEEKYALLSRGSVYILPTYAEGLPIAILEAMAGGNAIVTTDVGSIPSVVDDANGVLVSPGNVDELTEAIEPLLSDLDRTRRMCKESRTRVESGYSWEAMTERLVSLYRRVLNTPKNESEPHSRVSPLAED